MPMNTPPFSTQYSILCGQLADGSPVIIPVDASGNLPVSVSDNASVTTPSAWITYGALGAACATKDAYDALAVAPTSIPLECGVSGLRVSLMNTTAAQNGKLAVLHFKSDGSLVEIVEVDVPDADLTMGWDRTFWGAPAGNEVKPKQSIKVDLKQDSASGDYATLVMSALEGGAFYARVQVI